MGQDRALYSVVPEMDVDAGCLWVRYHALVMMIDLSGARLVLGVLAVATLLYGVSYIRSEP